MFISDVCINVFDHLGEYVGGVLQFCHALAWFGSSEACFSGLLTSLYSYFYPMTLSRARRVPSVLKKPLQSRSSGPHVLVMDVITFRARANVESILLRSGTRHKMSRLHGNILDLTVSRRKTEHRFSPR